MSTFQRQCQQIAALAAICILGACANSNPPSPPPGPALQAPPAMRLEGVPPLPAGLLQAAERYNNVAGHAFVDWHPTKLEMLVLHRPPGASTPQLWRLRGPTATPDVLTDGSQPTSGARWEPREGRYIVFARGSGGDEAFQLYRLDPDTRATTQITPAGQRHALEDWVRSRGLVLVSSVPLDRTAEGGRRSSINTTLSTIDPLNPAERRVVAELPGSGWSGAELSPDEKQLAITRYVSITESELWLIDMATGQRRQLLPAPGEPLKATHYVAGWSKDNRALFVGSDRAAEFNELLRLDLAGGALTRLTANTPWDVRLDSHSADRRQAALLVNADGSGQLRVIDSQTGAAQPLPALPGGSITRGKFHPSLGDLAILVNSSQGPAQIHVINGQRQTVTAWTQPAGTEGLNLQHLPEQQIVRWPSFDGRTISGVLSLPPARFTGKRPVLMLVHGGPEGQSRQGWLGRWNHLLQEMGVAIFQPNVRGSTGYGKTFVSLDNGRLREDSVKDMGTAIDWMASHPRLDSQRVVVMGGSYGGYMALAASTKLADKIAGASASVGISSFITFLENTETYRRDLRRAEYGDERDPAMRAFLQSISPLTHADKISKPLMVSQGKNDPRVPWTESEQIVRNLQARGTPVWYLLADNEGHGFARRENSDFHFAATLKFLQDTLKP